MPVAESPILSIVIPTRNRHQYLAKLIFALLKFSARDFEVVVHDNSDDNSQYRELCGAVIDSRLKYIFEPRFMPVTENCERGLSLASGSFVCMIGDDDGVLEAIVGLSRWMKSNQIDAAVSPVCDYLWPDVSSVLDGIQSRGILRLPHYTGKVEFRDEAAALDVVLRSGGIRIGDLPSVYQGVISRRALDALKRLTGTYFPGPSPDMSNAVGLSAVINRFVKVNVPVIISGVCASSGAAEGVRHEHLSEVSARTYLAADTVPLWPKEVPFYFSGPTIWATSLVRALIATERQSLLTKIRMDRLYAACRVFAPQYRSRVDAARASNSGAVSTIALLSSIFWIWNLRARAASANLSQKLEGALRGKRRSVGLTHIGEVITYVGKRYDRHPYDGTFNS